MPRVFCTVESDDNECRRICATAGDSTNLRVAAVEGDTLVVGVGLAEAFGALDPPDPLDEDKADGGVVEGSKSDMLISSESDVGML